MKEESLNRVIEILEQNSSEEDGYFEFYYDDFLDYETIKANKDGLIIYAKNLLKSVKQFDLKKKQKEEGDIDNFIKFEIGSWFVENNFSLPYI